MEIKVILSCVVFISLCLVICKIECNLNNGTILVTLHGRGESMNAGNAHSFVTRLQSLLRNRSLENTYKVINVGLSDDSNEDYDWSSYRSMAYQSIKLCQYLNRPQIWQQLMNSSRIVLIGFSQGGLLFRGLLSTQCLDPLLPRIDRLITFGGPHSGVFGKPDCSQMDTKYQILIKACNFIQKFDDITGLGPRLYDIVMYTELAEIAFSAASYWNSPDNKLERKTWLAEIDNQDNGCQTNYDRYLSRKLNRGLVLIAFGLEETVLPPISSSFGYWDSKAKNLIPYNETDLYIYDWIGLRELDEKNLLKFYTIENEPHMSIPTNFIYNDLFNFIN